MSSEFAFYKIKIAELEAEIKRLRAEVEGMEAACDSYAAENQRFHDEIERLRAEVATYKTDTENTENRLIDVEFASTEAKTEVEELREYRRTHPYCEIDMDMHVEAVMSTANGAIKELEREVERLHVAIRAAFDALEDGDEAGAHLILRFIGGDS